MSFIKEIEQAPEDAKDAAERKLLELLDKMPKYEAYPSVEETVKNLKAFAKKIKSRSGAVGSSLGS